MNDFDQGLTIGLSLGLLIGAIGVAFVGGTALKAIREFRKSKS